MQIKALYPSIVVRLRALTPSPFFLFLFGFFSFLSTVFEPREASAIAMDDWNKAEDAFAEVIADSVASLSTFA